MDAAADHAAPALSNVDPLAASVVACLLFGFEEEREPA
jgi:hypothetical protein